CSSVGEATRNLSYRVVIASFTGETCEAGPKMKVMISLAGSPVGSTVTISGHDHRFGEDYEVDAFLPADLPTEVELPPATWMAITEAMAELGRLDAAAGLVPNPHLITRIATRREAVGTSALEGTYANLTDVF